MRHFCQLCTIRSGLQCVNVLFCLTIHVYICNDLQCTCKRKTEVILYYIHVNTDGDFWRREHHRMFLSRGLKWYLGKIISPETNYNLPKILSFQTPRYYEHFVMFLTTKSPSVILLWHPLPCRASALVEILTVQLISAGDGGFLARSVMRTVCVINTQRAVKGGQHTFWNDSIASSFCHLFVWKIFPEWKYFVVSINVPPPQMWGEEHTELWFNHVTVFSQSVTRIRLSHIICMVLLVNPKWAISPLS